MKLHSRKASFRMTLLVLLAGGLLAAALAFTRAVSAHPGVDLTAHEWGTFTSIAGNDGRAVEWRPQTGSRDLPEFVEHLEGADLKGGLTGTVRMETPVLYFYSAREATVSVHVAFKNGLITEWYPQVSKATPKGNLRNVALNSERIEGNVWWNSVHLEPAGAGEFPRDQAATHYYTARETAATPVRVKAGSMCQHEKFLFYRGVAAFPVPVSVTVDNDGNLLVRNQGTGEIPGVILFERRGERAGYRISRPLGTETLLEPPELTASVASLRTDLENLLVERGLFRDEAHAMVETWQESWFQEGTRLFYIVPESFVNTILPLTIEPAPSRLVRVFVGRIEVVSPATEREIRTALAMHDGPTIDSFGRFLMPILQVMSEKDPTRAKGIQESLAALER
jgi:hypothetical protein